MKVGALVHMYPPLHNAGAEHMLHALLQPMADADHDVTVVVEPSPGCPQMDDDYEYDGVRVTGSRKAIEDSDVLVTHLDRTPEVERLARTSGIPLVQIFHNHLRPKMARHIDLAVYNSFWLARRYPCQRAAQSIVVHPPIWPERYTVKEHGDSVTLINLCPAKGAALFYEVARLMPDVHFIGVRGAYGEQTPAPKLRNLTIMEQQTDVRRVYEKTGVLMMPSVYESYGRVALEAAMSGIPTVANPTDGLLEALGDGGVFVYQSKSPTQQRLERQRRELLPEHAPQWAEMVRMVLDDYPRYSKAAKKRAETLDAARDARRFSDALEHLMKGR